MTMAYLSGARRLGLLVVLGIAPVARADAPPDQTGAQAQTDEAKPRPKVSKQRAPQAPLPAVPAQGDAAPVTTTTMAPPLLELDLTPPPAAPACKVPLSTPTYATDQVQAAVISLSFPLPPGRPLKKALPELRYQQKTTEVDLGECYRQYLAEQAAQADRQK
jgi:hypothetical protein